MITHIKRLFSSSTTVPKQLTTTLNKISLSPSTDPGFVRFDSIESIEPSIVPPEIRNLCVNTSHHLFNVRFGPPLSKLTSAEQITGAMRFYENQEQWNKFTIVTGKTSIIQDQYQIFQ